VEAARDAGTALKEGRPNGVAALEVRDVRAPTALAVAVQSSGQAVVGAGAESLRAMLIVVAALAALPDGTRTQAVRMAGLVQVHQARLDRSKQTAPVLAVAAARQR
jgi:hypothetical protein